MRRINLLPWREAQRREQKQRFSRQTLGLLLVLIVVLVAGYAQTSSLLSEQQQRNGYLRQQIQSLQAEIDQYQGVNGSGPGSKEGLRMLAELSQTRETLVRILDELPRKVPDGVTLKEIKQQGQTLRISGDADNSARVSEFLRQLETATTLHSARLTVIKAAEQGSGSRQAFVLEMVMQQGRPQ